MIRFLKDGTVTVETEADLVVLLKHAPHLLEPVRSDATAEPILNGSGKSLNGQHPLPLKPEPMRSSVPPATLNQAGNLMIRFLDIVRYEPGLHTRHIAEMLGIPPNRINTIIQQISRKAKGFGMESSRIYFRTKPNRDESAYHPGADFDGFYARLLGEADQVV